MSIFDRDNNKKKKSPFAPFDPGAWRREYDRENERYHNSVCDHWDQHFCDDDEHY